VTTATIQVHVEPDHLALILGERASIEVEVFNGSPIVDEFRVDLIGPFVDPIRPEWVTTQPRTLALFPNTSGVVVLTLDIPAASQLLAGRHVAGIRIRSTTEAAHAFVAELPITVSSQPAIALHMDPQSVVGGGEAEASVVARNLGNVPVNLWFSATDPSNAITFSMEDTEVLLPPDQEVRVPVGLKARRPLLGTGVVRPYSITAELEDRAGDVGAEATPFVEAVRAEATFGQRARINGRILTMIGFMLPVAAILIAAFILRPQTDPVILSGPLTFGVAGVVDRVEVRPNEFVLAGQRLASMRGTDAEIAFQSASLELRRAIVDLEGMQTQKLVADAEALLGEDANTAPPEFLQALLEQLQASVESARAVSSTALTGLSDSLGRYCEGTASPPPECASQPVPLPAEFITLLTTEATNPLAVAVVDANANYRSAAATLQSVQRLAEQTEMVLTAAGGPPEPAPEGAPEPTEDEINAEVVAALAAASAQEQTEYELSLLEQQAVIAEAQLACRTALADVGRTVLRAPVDVIVIEVLVTAGAEVEGDAPIVVVERTDGRVFTPPGGNRAPATEDLPAGATCPGSIEEITVSDAAAASAASKG